MSQSRTFRDYMAEQMQDPRVRVRYYLWSVWFRFADLLHRVAWRIEGADPFDWHCPHCNRLIVEEAAE